MRKWIPAVLIVIAYIVSALLLPRLPEPAELDLSALLPFAVESDSGPRAWLAFGIPTVALAVWILFLALTSRPGFAVQRMLFGRWAPASVLEPEAIARFRSTYDLVVALVIAFVLAFQLTMVTLAAGGPAWIARVFVLLLGLGLAVMGNVMPRTRPNPIMGLRTRATLNDPLLWARLHRLFGGLLLASGVLVMLLGLVAMQYALMALVGSLLLSCLIVFIALLRSPGGSAKTGAVVLTSVLFGLSGASAQLPQGRPDSIPPAGVIEEARSFQNGALTFDGTLALPARMPAHTPVVSSWPARVQPIATATVRSRRPTCIASWPGSWPAAVLPVSGTTNADWVLVLSQRSAAPACRCCWFTEEWMSRLRRRIPTGCAPQSRTQPRSTFPTPITSSSPLPRWTSPCSARRIWTRHSRSYQSCPKASPTGSRAKRASDDSRIRQSPRPASAAS